MTDDLSPRPSVVLHQFSFVDALVAGLYEGAFRASDVLGAGDFGVGCGDALDGEIVLLDGVMHLCRGDGQVVDVAPDALDGVTGGAGQGDPSHGHSEYNLANQRTLLA